MFLIYKMLLLLLDLASTVGSKQTKALVDYTKTFLFENSTSSQIVFVKMSAQSETPE